jgi:hypothetical protein
LLRLLRDDSMHGRRDSGRVEWPEYAFAGCRQALPSMNQ